MNALTVDFPWAAVPEDENQLLILVFFEKIEEALADIRTFDKWGGVIFEVLMENLIWDSLSNEVRG